MISLFFVIILIVSLVMGVEFNNLNIEILFCIFFKYKFLILIVLSEFIVFMLVF